MRYFLIISLLFIATNLPAQNVTYEYDDAGNRIERAIIPQSMMKSSSSMPISTPMEDIVAEHRLKIYPNPTKGMLSVEIGNYSSDLQADFRILDMTGRTINTQKAKSGTVYFDLSNHPSGVYLLRININGEIVTWKVIKK